MPIVHSPMLQSVTQLGAVSLPRPLLKLRRGAHASPVVRGFVDTGAFFTLVDTGLALKSLGFTLEEVRAGKRVRLKGLTGAESEAYAHTLQLEVSPSTSRGDTLVIADATVCFTDVTMPFTFPCPILLGQFGGLARFTFVQHAPKTPPYCTYRTG